MQTAEVMQLMMMLTVFQCRIRNDATGENNDANGLNDEVITDFDDGDGVANGDMMMATGATVDANPV